MDMTKNPEKGADSKRSCHHGHSHGHRHSHRGHRAISLFTGKPRKENNHDEKEAKDKRSDKMLKATGILAVGGVIAIIIAGFIGGWLLVLVPLLSFIESWEYFLVAFIHLHAVMAILSYYKTVTTSPGFVPRNWVPNLPVAATLILFEILICAT